MQKLAYRDTSSRHPFDCVINELSSNRWVGVPTHHFRCRKAGRHARARAWLPGPCCPPLLAGWPSEPALGMGRLGEVQPGLMTFVGLHEADLKHPDSRARVLPVDKFWPEIAQAPPNNLIPMVASNPAAGAAVNTSHIPPDGPGARPSGARPFWGPIRRLARAGCRPICLPGSADQPQTLQTFPHR
jgi:hypothetical protein